MSTFLGLIEEIPGISIDCFDEDNLSSSAFFLSHCHTDHMRGLNYDFLNYLKQKNFLLYCSHLSKSFLLSKFSKFDNNFMKTNFIELPLDEARIINYEYNNTEYSLTVTSISSGHCPGSLMFLFYYKNQIILYTGDFRINKEDYFKLKSLHFSKPPVPLKIDNLYLDTTFLDLNFFKFPSRAESSEALCAAARNWIEKDSKNIIILEISALYGSEFIYIELSKILNKKIHVKDKVYELYSRMEVLKNYVTDDCESTPIHACVNKLDSIRNGVLKHRTINRNNILTIVPSVQKWCGKDTSTIIEWDNVRKQTINVIYSTHASYDELEAFILYFKPKKIHPCVCDDKSKAKIYKLLSDIQSKLLKLDDVNSEKLDKVNLSKFKNVKNSQFKSQIISDDESD